MNSALQCLSHLPQLHPHNDSFILDCTKRQKKNDYNLMSEWFKLQKEMRNDKNDGVINTSRILREFIKQCSMKDVFFQSFVQNDSQEFINLFIDLLHSSIKRKVKIDITGKPKTQYDLLKVDSIKAWGRFFEDDYSYIIKNFYSRILSLTSCPECDYLAKNHEPIATITLSLNPGYETIYDCLNEFIKDFTLDGDNSWKCEKCNKNVCPQKKINFWELSPVLIFSIKQFRIGGKIDQKIKFSEILNMEKYCLSKGIEAKVHYPKPMYLQESLKFLKHKKGDFPVTDSHTKKIITFPCDQHLKKNQIKYVIKVVSNFYKNNK